ncbi:hypothetical protein Tco_1054474 [Tanacetum coccineum]|uniref:Reverse transcriptase domain-containing protein n=1 Tax=Tanacetum coccineum TaxID=301880 RepID=A0ABQ5GWV0_9ASTR
MFHVSNLKKCYANEPLAVPLDGLHLDDKLHFVEEPLEIVGREVKRLKQSRIPLVKVRWNSKRGPEFTWEREDQFKKKYPHLFTKTTPSYEEYDIWLWRWSITLKSLIMMYGSSCTLLTSSTNLPEKCSCGFADEVIYSLFAKQSEDWDLLHEDLEQIDDVDIEEMDINWQIAMIAIRMKKFYKKTGRRVCVD